MGNKNCKHCQALIPAKAKVCPNCKKSQGMSTGIKILIGIVIFIVLIGMFGGSDEPTSTDSKKEDNKTNEENKENEDKKKTFNQNETVKFKGIKFSITNVEKHKGTKYNKPKDGFEYVEVTIKIENTSEEKYDYSPLDWKMQNSQGQELDTNFSALKDYDEQLDYADLRPGGTVTGKLGFEQPKGDAGLYLNYYDNIVWDEDYSFQIKIN